MDEDLTKPPLDPGTYQSIELEQYDLHKRHLATLRELQVLAITGESIRPQDPARLQQAVTAYASALFDTEANRYPNDHERLIGWLWALAAKTEEMMSRRIWEMDTTSVAKLTYHATREEIDAMMRSALNAKVEAARAEAHRQSQPPASPAPAAAVNIPAANSPATNIPANDFPAPEFTSPWNITVQADHQAAAPLALAAAAGSDTLALPLDFKPNTPEPAPAAPPVGDQIRSLRFDSRFTIEELAKKVGIASRTVQRHESGEVQDIRLRHVRSYERVFSATLKRPVRLENVNKASR